MAEQKSILRWISYINMACIKSFIDLKQYVLNGTVDTWFHGWQPLAAHPVAASFNVLLDAGSIFGMLLTLREAVASSKRERRAHPDTETPAA